METTGFDFGMIGLGVSALALAGGASVFYGFSHASSVHQQLLAQQTPVDVQQRKSLIAGGERANVLALVGALVGAIAGAGSAYFLAASF